MNTASIVSRVWSFCTTLRDDGVGYGDYLEQLTYLIFLKMADEYSKPPYSRDVGILEQYNWHSLGVAPSLVSSERLTFYHIAPRP